MDSNSEILNQLQCGTATNEQISAAFKAVQNTLAITLVQRASSLEESLKAFDGILERSIQIIQQKFAEQSAADTISLKSALNLATKIQARQLEMIDLYRKIVQGSPLFVSDTLTEEEKTVVRLLNSFDSPEEKQKFLRLCQEKLNE